MSSPIIRKTCNLLVRDAQQQDGLPVEPPGFIIELLRLAYGGLWVGGYVTLHADRLEFEPSALNRGLHENVTGRVLPLADITAVRRKFGVLSGVIVLETTTGEWRVRCWGAKALAMLIDEVRRRKASAPARAHEPRASQAAISIHVNTSRGERSITIPHLPCTIGSDPRDGVRLKHPSVHPDHAVLTRSHDGTPMIAPRAGQVRSAGGILNAPAPLGDGARFRIGDVGITVRIERPGPIGAHASATGAASGQRRPTQAHEPLAAAAMRAAPQASDLTAQAPVPPSQPARTGTSWTMLSVYAGIILVLLSGASIPVYLVYAQFTEDRARATSASAAATAAATGTAGEPSTAEPGADTAAAAGTLPATETDAQVETVADLLRKSEQLATVRRGKQRLGIDDMIRELERQGSIYRDFNEAYDGIRSAGNFKPCDEAREHCAMVELIASRFETRARGESAETQIDALEKLADRAKLSTLKAFAELMQVPVTEITDDIYSGRPRPAEGWKGWASEGNHEDAWGVERFGESGVRARLAAGVAKARGAATDACRAAEQRQERLIAAARAVAALDTENLLGPGFEPVDAKSLSYVQREHAAEQVKRLEDAHSSASENVRNIERDLALGWLTVGKQRELGAYTLRLRQLQVHGWWFRVPALRAALDAQVAYENEDPREWATAFLRSMRELPKADIAEIARKRWELDGNAEHQRRYKGTKYEGPGPDDVERETPAWLEQTILGEVLLKSRRDPAWRARVKAEAPLHFKSIEAWLGPVSDGTDLDHERSSLDPSAPPPPPPPPQVPSGR